MRVRQLFRENGVAECGGVWALDVDTNVRDHRY